MNNEQLKKWLRDNSSGVYRPSRHAADVIDELERENNRLRDLLNSDEWIHAVAKNLARKAEDESFGFMGQRDFYELIKTYAPK